MRCPDHGAAAFHPRCLTTAGAVQGKPSTTLFEPGTQGLVLSFVGIRPGDIGDQHVGAVQPVTQITEIRADGCADIVEPTDLSQQVQTRGIHVVTGHGTARIAAGDQMYTLAHVVRLKLVNPKMYLLISLRTRWGRLMRRIQGGEEPWDRWKD